MSQPAPDAAPPSPAHGLWLTADGAWLHDGDSVDHARLCALLHRSIVREPSGALVVTTGRDRLPFGCEDLPLRVLSARVEGAGVRVELSNERSASVGQGELFVDVDGSLWCAAPGGLRARFSRAAQLSLADALEEDGPGFALRTGDGLLRISAAPAR